LGSFKASRVDIEASISTGTFVPGNCRVTVRGADTRGIWGRPETVSHLYELPDQAKPGPIVKDLVVRDGGKGSVTIDAVAVSEDGLNISQAEWWIGDDPGSAKASPMSGSFSSSVANVTAKIGISDLKSGVNIIRARCADARGIWGQPGTVVYNVDRPQAHLARYMVVGAAIAICLVVLYKWIAPNPAPSEKPASRQMATLSVDTSPSGAFLKIDGKDRGLTPQDGMKVAPGKHHIVMKKEGFVKIDEYTSLESGEKKSFSRSLEKMQQPSEVGPEPAKAEKVSPKEPDLPISADDKISGFIQRYYKDTEARNVNVILSYYGERVDYYSKSAAGKDFIRKDKEAYFKRWTTVVHTVEGQPEIMKGPDDTTRVVRFSSHFLVKNDKKSITGRADNKWTLKYVNNGWKIIGEQQHVLNRDKGEAKAPSAVAKDALSGADPPRGRILRVYSRADDSMEWFEGPAHR
jgi:hypothetical protein